MNQRFHPDLWGNSKIRITPEGGMAIRLTNQTGEVSVKGKLVSPSVTTNFAVGLTVVGDPDPIGAIYDAGVAVGSEMWVVISGMADVLFAGNVVREQFARMTVAADTGDGPGIAIAENFPTSPFATDKHFMEIGHCIEARTGAGLARVVLHFN